jgi:tetratricopeptide (TPR) repeat protein
MIKSESRIHNSQFIIHNTCPARRYKCSQFTILTIILLAFALNLHALAADSFWGDEIFTAIFAGQAPTEVIRWTAGDIHPPLYYLLGGAFTRLTIPLGLNQEPSPISDWLWRFPSTLAVVLAVAVTYRLAFHLTDPVDFRSPFPLSRPVAISAALLLAVAPIAIKYGQEARMHALFMLLSGLSTWLFFRAMAQPHRWSRWLAFAVATTANIYTMYFGFLILAAQAGYLLFAFIKSQTRRAGVPYLKPIGQVSQIPNPQGKCLKSHNPNLTAQIIGFIAATALIGILYLPWWPILFDILRRRAAVGAIEGGVGDPLEFIRGVVRALGPLPEPVAWLFLLLFITGVIFLARRRWPVAAFAALWLGLPALLPIFLGDPRALQFRYAFVLPVYLIVIAYAIWQIAAWLGSWGQPERSNLQAPSSTLPLGQYLIWILTTLSFVASLGVYQQTKPDWRGAAAYLDEHTTPSDLILIGPLWDEGRFIDYYYRGQAQLLTPAVMVTNIERRVESLRASGGRIWAVNRFAPAESPVTKNVVFTGVVISEPTIPVYEPALLTTAVLDLAAQAVEAAYPWAATAAAQGVLNPDPRTAKAAALRAWGDALVAAGRPEEALRAYQQAVELFPGWVSGFLALAETQELVGNLAAAAAAYRQAVAFNLDWHGPLADEAAALVETGQWATALEKYHRIVGAK